jgi:hypothetical protein
MPSPRHCLFISLAAALSLSCAESNFEPVAPQRLDPPEVYRAWWSEVESCIGTAATFERVTWYQAEQLVNKQEGTNHAGAWLPPHTIYVRSDKLLFTAGVKHEMVHEILQRRDHDTPLYHSCAGI